MVKIFIYIVGIIYKLLENIVYAAYIIMFYKKFCAHADDVLVCSKVCAILELIVSIVVLYFMLLLAAATCWAGL